MIKESNLTHKEISEKCKLIGVNLNPSYISKLKTGKQPPASDEINKAIATVCGYEYQIENLLFEAYLEKAPDFIKELLNKTIQYLRESTKNTVTNQYSDEIKYDLSEYINNLSGYKVINNAIITMKSLNFGEINGDKVMQMPDDSMEPLIPRGATVHYEEIELVNDGDIIVVSINNSFQIRSCYSFGDKVLLIARDINSKPIEVIKNELIILGKVKYLVKEFH